MNNFLFLYKYNTSSHNILFKTVEYHGATDDSRSLLYCYLAYNCQYV